MSAALAPAQRTVYVHASCICLGEAGVLVRGPSGSGKSALCSLLVAEAQGTGRFARWVGDDRIGLTVHGGRVLARPHPAIAGRAEWRGLGPVPVRWEEAVRLSLVVDFGGGPPSRLPEDDETVTEVLGVCLPLMKAAAGEPVALVMAKIALRLQELGKKAAPEA